MKQYNKPHAEDRIEGKEAKEIYKEKTPEHKRSKGDVGSFEDAHVVHDSEAHSVKMSREKQKASLVKSQDLSTGVGEPKGNSGKLPHHMGHDPSVYMAASEIEPKKAAHEDRGLKNKGSKMKKDHGEDAEYESGEM